MLFHTYLSCRCCRRHDCRLILLPEQLPLVWVVRFVLREASSLKDQSELAAVVMAAGIGLAGVLSFCLQFIKLNSFMFGSI